MSFSNSPTQAAVEMERWGKDHWSLLGYLYTLAMDGKHEVDERRMRGDGAAYPTRLRHGEEARDHDDWNCMEDLEAAGLINFISRVNGFFAFEERGLKLAAKLAQHKARGGSFSDFMSSKR